jgi:hypothetical protein
MLYLSSHPEIDGKIKYFAEHYSNYYFGNSNEKINNIIKCSKNS